MKCSECGRELPEGSNYCRFCGAGRPGWEPAETKAQDAAGADLSAEDQPVQNEAVRAEQTAPEAAARDGVKAIALDAVEKVADEEMAQWMNDYPEAFERAYDPASGSHYAGWVEGVE